MRLWLGALLAASLAASASVLGASPEPLPSAVPSGGPTPAPSPSLAPSYAATTLLPDWNAVPGPIELPDLTLDKDGGIVLTLEKSIELAVRGAASVLKAQNEVKYTGAQLLQAYGQFLPNLTGVGNYGYATGTVYSAVATPTLVTGSGSTAGYTLTTDLNVFNGLADYSNLKSALLKKDAAELTLERARQQIALDIAQNFLQVVLDDKHVEIARKNLQQSQAREHLLSEQTKVGARNLSDLFRQQALTSTDESSLLTAENRTRTDQIRFLRRLRADVAKKYHFVEPPLVEGKVEERYENEGGLLRTALDKRVDLRAYEDFADAARWDARASFSNYLPKLDVIGSVLSGGRYLESQTVNGANVTPAVQSDLAYQLGSQVDYTVALNLTWTIFDRFLTHQNVARSNAVADNARIDAQDRRNQVEGEVRQAYGDYKTVTQQLRTSKRGLEAAQKAYEVMEGRYEVGSASFVDLFTVQAALVQAEGARADALVAFQLQSRSIQFATGELQVE